LKLGSGEGTPTHFTWQGEYHRVLNVCNRWWIHTRWWEPEHTIWREYWKVVTDKGLLCLICQDQFSHTWFLARVYD
jgi:hypothetical protein